MPRVHHIPRLAAVFAATLAAGTLAACGSGDEGGSTGSASSGPEQTGVKMALTGGGSLSNVVMYLAQELGYFKDAGVKVSFVDVTGGSDVIQALITNTVDATTNEYDHTIEVQTKGKAIEEVALFRQTPSFSLMVTKDHPEIQSVKDLAGKKIGVVSLGGSTEDVVHYLLQANGLDPDSAELVSIGATSTAIAAVRSGQVDALIAVEPTLTKLVESGQARNLVDLRTPRATKEVYGGPAPFWSLLVRNDFAGDKAKTTQALVTASVRAVDYLHTHTPQEVADHVPGDVFYPDGDKAFFVKTLKANLPSFSADGQMPEGGPQRSLEYLKEANPDTDYSGVDLQKTYDNSFAEKAADARGGDQ
jgi:NitT/TauT family transport system substrate-binding protein